MKKLFVSIVMLIAIAGPRLAYASVDPYAALSRSQKDALIVQLTGLLHKLLAQIALIQSERGTLVSMSDEQIEPAADPVAPQVEPEKLSHETSQDFGGYSGPPGYSSLAI